MRANIKSPVASSPSLRSRHRGQQRQRQRIQKINRRGERILHQRTHRRQRYQHHHPLPLEFRLTAALLLPPDNHRAQQHHQRSQRRHRIPHCLRRFPLIVLALTQASLQPQADRRAHDFPLKFSQVHCRRNQSHQRQREHAFLDRCGTKHSQVDRARNRARSHTKQELPHASRPRIRHQENNHRAASPQRNGTTARNIVLNRCPVPARTLRSPSTDQHRYGRADGSTNWYNSASPSRARKTWNSVARNSRMRPC